MARKSRANLYVDQVSVSAALYHAGLYRRLSDEDGENTEQNSIGNQKKIGLFYLSEHPEIQLVDIYTDNGFTGMNYNRPEFKRMLNDLKTGRINCVIIKDISRLGRNFVQTSEFVEQIFPEMGIRLICVNDNYDSTDENADAASLTLPLKMVMNDYYVKDISRKIRSSISAKMEDGEYLPSSSSIPYGYIRNPEKLTYDIDPEPAAIIQRIYEMRASGMKFNAIARQLNAEHIISPGRLRFVRGVTKDKRFETAEWIRGTIRKITNDPVYLGQRIHGKIKRDKVGMEKTRRDASEWQVIEQAHPPIITQELFNDVQKVNLDELAARQAYEKRADAGVDYRELLQGKLICGDCKSTMIPAKGCARPNAKTPSRIFYDCNEYKYSNHARCSSHYIRQEALMESITDLLNQQVAVCVEIEKLIVDVQNFPRVAVHQRTAHDVYQSACVRRKNMEAKIEHLLIDLTERLISRDEYLYMKEQYSLQYEDLLAAEASALKEYQRFESAVSTTKKWLDAVKKYQQIPFITREIIDALIDSIEVYGDKHIKINLNYADPYQPIMRYLNEIGVILDAG